MITRSVICVFLGGGLGSVFRHLIAARIKTQINDAFPWSTLIVNILGSFIVGTLTALALRHKWFEAIGKDLLIVGFCGGFTTFSALALEELRLIENKRPWLAIAYASMSVGVGLWAVVMGLLLVKWICR